MNEGDSARLQRWRDDTPGTAGRCHLNNAGAALMPRPVVDAVRDHLDLEAAIGGYEAGDLMADRLRDAYAAVADLTGTAPRNVAMVDSATTGFVRALSTVAWSPGDVLVTTRNDYVSNQLAFLSLAQRRGVRIRRAHDLPAGGADPESVAELARDPRCRLVAVTWVPTNSGLVQPVADIGGVCESLGVRYLIDACQAAGQIPIDVPALRCDYLSATGRKFLRGPRGTGFLIVSDSALERGDAPAFPDVRSATWIDADAFRLAADATRFEYWELSIAGVLGLGSAAAYANRAGVAATGARARALAERLREQLAARDGIRVLDVGRERCAIVSLEIRGRLGADVVRLLRDRGINTSSIQREGAVLAFDAAAAMSGLRVSPHYYNLESEIDGAAAAISEIGPAD
jgi:selenocysteine lyase/cysteine desulfurase